VLHDQLTRLILFIRHPRSTEYAVVVDVVAEARHEQKAEES
jgi:hypothetical protein